MCGSFGFAQTVLEGTVIDQTFGGGVIGATVVIQGTDIQTETDFDGNFKIETKKISSFFSKLHTTTIMVFWNFDELF